MAPRIPHCQVSPYLMVTQHSKSSLCALCSSRLHRKQFSTTPHPATIIRDEMFRWLNGPGSAFKQPLPGSTNYLSAYDKYGNLLRAPNAPVPGSLNEKQPEAPRKEEKDSETDRKSEDGEDQPPERKKSEKLLQEQEKAANRQPSIPPEGPQDLMPFPMNKAFRSQPVLSDELKDEIYRRIVVDKKSVREVSTSLGVEMRRIGAVVRLKAVEKQWEDEGKVFATPYARAVMSMLPQTPYVPKDPILHESINDLPIHYATRSQIFHPVSESRHFTRRDAAKVFDPTLLPAEDRIPHPQQYQIEKWKLEGMVPGERAAKGRELYEQETERRQKLQRMRKEKEESTTQRATTSRWEFKIQDFSAEPFDKQDRSWKGVGAWYGIPHEDRKKGQIKIPRKVDV